MEIREIKEDKKIYIELLLLADEEERMIDEYLERGQMFVLDDEGIKAECVVTQEGDNVIEIKNIAVYPKYQKKGYGKKLIEFIETKYKNDFDIIRVGTGDSRLTVPFYENCGFRKSYCIKDFFVNNYENPIYEDGIRLKDMVYLEKNLH
jgi:GNAT superfamily N-acetyltransferase